MTHTVSQRLASLSGLMAIFAALVLVGCTQQTEMPPQVTSGLDNLRSQLIKGKAQVQMTSNAARDLTTRAQAQVGPQIDALQREIAAMDKLATDSRAQYATSEEKAKAYFSEWEKQLATMDRDLSVAGKDRQLDAQRSVDKLKEKVEDLRAEFRPYMKSLTEASKYLQGDPTSAGVKVATPSLNNALEKENTLMKKADAVVAQIDSMRGGK